MTTYLESEEFKDAEFTYSGWKLVEIPSGKSHEQTTLSYTTITNKKDLQKLCDTVSACRVQ